MLRRPWSIGVLAGPLLSDADPDGELWGSPLVPPPSLPLPSTVGSSGLAFGRG